MIANSFCHRWAVKNTVSGMYGFLKSQLFDAIRGRAHFFFPPMCALHSYNNSSFLFFACHLFYRVAPIQPNITDALDYTKSFHERARYVLSQSYTHANTLTRRHYHHRWHLCKSLQLFVVCISPTAWNAMSSFILLFRLDVDKKSPWHPAPTLYQCGSKRNETNNKQHVRCTI